jgi:hypothetical protein
MLGTQRHHRADCRHHQGRILKPYRHALPDDALTPMVSFMVDGSAVIADKPRLVAERLPLLDDAQSVESLGGASRDVGDASALPGVHESHISPKVT